MVTFLKNISKIYEQGYKGDNDNKPVSDNITNPDTHQDNPT